MSHRAPSKTCQPCWFQIVIHFAGMRNCAKRAKCRLVNMYNQQRIVIVFVAFMADGRMVIRNIKLIIKSIFQVSESSVAYSASIIIIDLILQCCYHNFIFGAGSSIGLGRPTCADQSIGERGIRHNSGDGSSYPCFFYPAQPDPVSNSCSKVTNNVEQRFNRMQQECWH